MNTNTHSYTPNPYLYHPIQNESETITNRAYNSGNTMKKTCAHYPTWSTLVRERTRRINEGLFQRNSTYHYPDEFRSIHIQTVVYSNEFNKPAFYVTLKNGRTLKLTLKNMDIEHYDALIQWTEYQHGILSGYPKGTGPKVSCDGSLLEPVSA